MSVLARSRRSAGRLVLGRPAYAVVVALTAAFAVGAPAAAAGESPDPTVPVPDAVDVPSPEDIPQGVDAPSPEPVVPEVPVPEPDPPPVAPPPAEPPPGDPPTGDPPTEPPPTDPSPAEPPAAEPLPVAEEPPGVPEPATPDSGRVIAENLGRVIQAVWQVQQGCRTYCYGTSQSQRSVQWSETTQSATAVSGGGGGQASAGGSTAEARNEATTIQFVWQMQIGCVAFCFDTSQTQEASQDAYTTQLADAQSALMAWAENLAQTVQYVFQTQRGCERECYGTSQSQTASQRQSTSQTSTANAQADNGPPMLPDWLIAFAQNIGATIQMSYQYQEAACLEHCTGDAQVQEAIQRAETDQRAVALAPRPPAPAGGPQAGEPPRGEPPTEPGTAPGVEPAGVPPAAGPSAALARRSPATLGRRSRRTSRRVEIVLRARTRAVTSTSGGTPPSGATSSVAETERSTIVAATARSTATAPQRRDSERPTPDTAAGAPGGQLPSTTFVVPAGDSDGSGAWLLIALLAAPIAGLVGLLCMKLASNLTRI
jgi:outer membrane biosynthesis protein TonB